MAQIGIEFSERVGISMYRNGAELLVSAPIESGADELKDVTVVVSPGIPFFAEASTRFDRIAPGETVDAAERINIVPNLDFIASLEVRTPSTVTISLRDSENNEIASASCMTEILPYDYWAGSYLPESIASFVTPGCDSLAQVRSLATQTLERWGRSPSLEGYQADVNRIQEFGAAVFSALKRLGIVYVNPPTDFEKSGQRIRLPSEVIAKREGTCVDLAVLYCSVLESMGLNTVIFIVKEHAFAGFWLIDDHATDIVTSDPSRFTRSIRNGELRAVECTMFVSGNTSTFEAATNAALARLEDVESFEYAVDIAAARSTILPIPTRTLLDGRYVLEKQLSEDSSCAPAAVGEVYEDPVQRRTTRVDRWKRELLDTGMRNSLINLRPGTKAIPLLVSEVVGFEDAFSGGKEFTILSRPQDWNGADTYAMRPFESELFMGNYAPASKSELQRGWVRTPYTDDGTETACRYLYRSAVKELDESGCNALFLAIGMLRWHEIRGDAPRYAPLILVPAELCKRNSGYAIKPLDDETMFNVTLAELLRQEYEINIPGIDPLPTDDSGINVEQVLQTVRRAVAGMEGWEVLRGAAIGVFTFSQYAMWKDLGSNLPKLEENEVVRCLVEGRVMTGTQDIDVSADPYGLCLTVSADASQIRAVRAAGEGLSFVMHGPPGTGKSQTITNIITDSLYRGKTVLFVAEKRAALEVVQGRLKNVGIGNHCLELHSDKTEKTKVLDQLRASLESCKAVDPKKLDELTADIERERESLDAYVTELHAPVVAGLSAYECISRAEACSGKDVPDVRVPEKYVASLEPKTLGELEDKVSRAVRIYSTVSDMDVPVIAKVGVSEAVLGLDDTISSALDAACKAADALDSATASMDSLGLPIDFSHAESALASMDAVSAIPAEFVYDSDLIGTINYLNSLSASLRGISSGCATFPDISAVSRCRDVEAGIGVADSVAGSLVSKGFRSVAATTMLVDAKAAAELRSRIDPDLNAILAVWKPSILKSDIARSLSGEYNRVAGTVFLFRKKEVQKFMDSVSGYLLNPSADFQSLAASAAAIPGVVSNLAVLSELVPRISSSCDTAVGECAALSASLSASYRSLVATGIKNSDLPAIRTKLDGAKTLADAYRAAVSGYAEASGRLAETLVYEGGFGSAQELREFCGAVSGFRGRFFDWAGWNVCRSWFVERDLGAVVDVIRSGASGDVARSAASRGMYRTMFGICRRGSETLRLFSSGSFESDIEKFRKLDEKYAEYNRALLKYKLYQRTPRDLSSSVAGSEAATLYRAINSSRIRKSVRQLLSEIPNILPMICPCLLMSPQSVAQYITPDFPKFDLVIFDESSQIVTAKAIGALGRGKAAVVAGDNKQLPPTSFFQKKIEAGDDDDAIDVESFLDDCLGVRMPETYLQWHYRSRHESLIGFSNRIFYGNHMLTFPSPNDSETKVSLVHVDGMYEKGKRCNPVEARAVAEEIRRRVMDDELVKKSVGIIAFSISQQNAIEDILDDMEKADKKFSKRLSLFPEQMFVKNLETVQGDERDVIIFSIGYGPGKDGTVFQNFGPLNRGGGGRRLNVAVSRARDEMIVFSSMSHADVKVTATSSSGVKAMRDFLRYAMNGGRFGLDCNTEPRPGDSAILRELASALEEKGYECRYDIGTSEFRVDLAVVDPKNPERYILGILSDGESYKASENTRDREYARADILRRLGWETMNVWSVEWYFRRDIVIKAVSDRIGKILASRPDPEPEAVPEPAAEEAPETPEEDGPPASVSPMPSRRPAVSTEKLTSLKPGQDVYSPRIMANIAEEIIDNESPVCEKQLVKEYCRLADIRSLPQTRRDAFVRAIRAEFPPEERGEFVTYWKNGENPEEYTTYRVPEDRRAVPDIDLVPLPDILSAIREVASSVGPVAKDSMPLAVARLLGYTRAGDRIKAVVGTALEFALEDGIVALEDGKYMKP